MLKNILKAALFTPVAGGRWGLPILAWGPPGVGKTAIIEGVAAEWGLACESLSPGERGEGAFGVVPVPSTDGTLTYPRPEWTRQFDATTRGLVFVDELTTAPPALQAPLLGLVLSRRIGGFSLPAGVRVFAAANPPEQAAGGFDLAPPVANRFGHLEWAAPSVDDHCAYMLGAASDTTQASDASEEEARVLAAWPAAWSRAVGLETAFLQRRPGLKNAMPQAGDPKASRGWASDRSWEAATRALASAAVHGLSAAETEEFVAGFIGEAIASEWFAFIAEQDLPDPAALLDGAAQYAHNPLRLDRTVAVLAACAALVLPPKAARRAERVRALWALISEMSASKADLDLFVPVCQALVGAGLVNLVDAGPVLAALQPILKAAGVKGGR
jgi:MoxR-like ATPase